MTNCVAERRLFFSPKGVDERSELIVQIHQPYLVTQEMVSFRVAENTGGCRVVIVGFPENFEEVTYGADTLQALQLAADVEPLLKRLSKNYDLFFPTGEPYFE